LSTTDAIGPPLAGRPAQALELLGEALSEGDLDGAVALYEPDATLGLAEGARGPGTVEVRALLAQVMGLRLPVRVRVRGEMAGPDLALVLAVREVEGRAGDGRAVMLTGDGGAVVRRGPDHVWRLAVDDWRLPAPPASSPSATRGR